MRKKHGTEKPLPGRGRGPDFRPAVDQQRCREPVVFRGRGRSSVVDAVIGASCFFKHAVSRMPAADAEEETGRSCGARSWYSSQIL
jgi:hypothetical protein